MAVRMDSESVTQSGNLGTVSLRDKWSHNLRSRIQFSQRAGVACQGAGIACAKALWLDRARLQAVQLECGETGKDVRLEAQNVRIRQ